MFQPLRYALRQLRRSPGFALSAVLILALGIGATTAIFTVLDAVLLQPLPFPHPDQLVAIATVPDLVVSIPTVQDWQTRSHSFESIAAYRGWSPTVQRQGGTETGRVLEVSQNFLSTLGIRVALGQDFLRSANEKDCSSQVIVSGGFWKRIGNSSSNLSGRTIQLDRHTYQIVGVLPVAQTIEGTGSLNQPDIFVPLGCDPSQRPSNRGSFSWWAIGRFHPGVSIAEASADLARVQNTLQRDYPNDYNGFMRQPPSLTPWITLLTGADTRPALLSTLAACGLLLLIACANLGNLLLARNMRRRHEFATRATLGASLGQLLRQLLLESALLSIAGSAAGIALALGAVRLLQATRAVHLPRLSHASLSPAVLVFTTLVAVAVTVLLTLLPAWRTLQPSLLRDLAGSGRSSAGRSLYRAGRMLVVAQIALTFVLVACAGWMIASMYALLHQPLGFAPDHLLMAGVDVHGTSVAAEYDPERTNLFFTQVIGDLSRLPGVESVAATNHPPLGHAINRYDFCSDTHPEQWLHQLTINPNSYHVTPGYFSTVGQTLLSGRGFTPSDSAARHVAIVNRALAAREWPGQSAIGHRIRTGDVGAWATVVGVVGDVRSTDLTSAPGPDLYLPQADQPATGMVLVLRTKGDPALLAHTVRGTIRSHHPDLALYRLETMAQEMAAEVEQRRFLMQVAAAFGALSLLIAVLGTYGLLAYEVSLREKEIGIRIALGSSREGIVRLLLRQESRWIFCGTVLGLLCATLAGYLLRSQFYQAQQASLPVLVGTALLLAVPSLAATFIPARRAANQDCVQALRSD